MHVEPLFIDSLEPAAGRRFALYHAPQGGQAGGLVVHVHGFAEEMNKSRRMAALQSRALAAAGYAVLQIDLAGCGDSEAAAGTPLWQAWVDDVLLACGWLLRHAATGSTGPTGTTAAALWLWGVRAGALLAAAAAAQLERPCNLLLWHPVVAGKVHLQQFLRLHSAAQMLSGTKGAPTLRSRLEAGDAVEVAGYALAPALCDALDQARLSPPPVATPGRVEWLDLSSLEGAAPSPASLAAASAWTAAGWHLRQQVVPGPAFWQTTEIEEVPALITATLAALQTPLHVNEPVAA